MVLDPVTTFAVYIGAIGLLFAVCAAVADYLTAKAERDARRRARATARAKRMREKETSNVEWL